MKVLLAFTVLLVVPLINAEQREPLPRFSTERFEFIDSVLSKTKFPVSVMSLCAKLGGESSLRFAAFESTSDTLTAYFSISEEVDGGVFQIEMAVSGNGESILERRCAAARLVYLREGILFSHDPGHLMIPKQKPNQSSQPPRPTGG